MTDSTGAVIVGVSIRLHNVDTGVDIAGATNQSGFYRFSSVAPGNYTIVAAHTGFKTESIAVSVTTDETRGIDVKLVPETVGENVTVTAIATELNPDETRIQNTISSQEISSLPLANRDPQLLLALTPGVTGFQNESPSGGYGSSIFAGNFQPNYVANGEGVHSNLFLIDDLPVSDDMTQGAAMILPNVDMIGEVALQTQTFSVDNGTSASLQTSYTTKSGNNSFHGSADYSYAGKNLGAAEQPVHAPGTPVTNTAPEFHQDMMLASLGGPIIKDRTFFFGSMQRQLAGIGVSEITDPYFSQSFATWALSTFPNSPTAYGLNFAPPTRDLPNTGTAMTAQSYPSMGCGTQQTVTADPSLTYNIPCDQVVYVVNGIFDQAQPFDGLQWNVRLDHTMRNGNDRIYVMYERIDQTLGDLAERPALDSRSPSQNKYFSVNWVHVFNPRLLNEVHFGNLRAFGGNLLGNEAAASIPYLPILLDTAANYQFTFPFGITPFASEINKEHTYAFRDALSYTKGNHVIRTGYQFYRGDAFQDASGIYTRAFVPYYFTDTFSWVSNTKAAGYSLYTIGGNGQYAPQFYGATSIYNGAFVEDTWKVRRNLTITAGIRYDNFGNPTKYGSQAQPFVPLFPGSGNSFQEQAWGTTTHIATTAFTQGQNVNFMPRAGFAYTPFDNKHLLIRGGIGLYENVMTPFQIAANLPTQPPNRISLYETSIVPYGDFKTTSAPYGYNYSYPTYGTDPSGNIYSNPEHTAVFSANLNGFAPNVKPEKYLHYSFGIEQEFAYNIVAGLSYAGGYGYDLIYGSSTSGGGGNSDYNLEPDSPSARPTPEWGELDYGRNGLHSNYNALILTLRQNYKGLSYQASYTWSKSMQNAPTFTDQNSGDGYYVWKGIYDPASYYGPSSFDVADAFSLGGSYELPHLFANERLLDEAVGGWKLGTIVIAQTGTPFTVDDTGVDYQNDGSSTFDGAGGGTPAFPTYSGSKRKGFSRSEVLAGAFTASQFTDPVGVGTGPVTAEQGANSFRNLGYFRVDLSLSKGFNFPIPKIADHAKFFFRAEAINLLNRTNWQSIWNGMASEAAGSNFGTVTTANQKRYLQLGGRFEF